MSVVVGGTVQIRHARIRATQSVNKEAIPLYWWLGVVLIGENEVLYNPSDVADRIHANSTSTKVDIIPGAKHMISMDKADLFSERLIQFSG